MLLFFKSWPLCWRARVGYEIQCFVWFILAVGVACTANGGQCGDLLFCDTALGSPVCDCGSIHVAGTTGVTLMCTATRMFSQADISHFQHISWFLFALIGQST